MPIYAVDKPLAMSSHDVVAIARRQLGTRRVGHAGTLDPLASGVLVLLSDGATKLSPFLTGKPKSYLAWVAFGAGTPTLDAEGPVTDVADASALRASDVAAALEPFLEITEQRPPAYSAVKRQGVRSYQRARAGDLTELPARPAGYARLELIDFAPNRESLRAVDELPPSAQATALPRPLMPLPTALIRMRVQAGTYVRALARDLGEALGLPAHLAGLVRTRSGSIGLERCVPLERLPDAATVPALLALDLPELRLDADATRRVRQGQVLRLDLPERTALVGPEGELVAIAEEQAGRTRTLRVWQEPESP